MHFSSRRNFTRMLDKACAISRKRSERRTDLELERLVLVACVFDDRQSVIKLERADRGDPLEAQTVAVPQAVCPSGRVAAAAPAVTAVHEREDAQRAVVAGAGQRERELDISDDHLRPADRVTC